MACLKNISIVFSGGCLGGVVNSITVWFFGKLGITGALGVGIAPAFSLQWLYPRIIWGGIWGFLFLMPFLKRKSLLKGLLYSLPPTLVQLFIVFPLKAGKGIMGLGLGGFTPVFVVTFNAIWGLTAVYWIYLSDEW